ncbi:MAG: rhomboid family intramembrane serine protease [Planctomycetota bacterium]
MAFRPNWYESESGRGDMGFRRPGGWSGVRWTITLTVAVFLLQALIPDITVFGALRAWTPTVTRVMPGEQIPVAFNVLFPVQLLTYGLLHANFMHLFWNMLFMFFFAPDLEALFGKARFLKLYIGGIVTAGLCQWLWWVVRGEPGWVVGASGGVFTVMVLFALRWPHRVLYIWGILPVPVWAFVLFMVVGNIAGFLGGNQGTTSFLAHLGGAAFALVWDRLGPALERRGAQRKREKALESFQEEAGDRREMDRILAKIQASGLGSLDSRERAFLDRRSQQLRDQGR